MSIIIALIIFSLIILFHEFGHFLLAKLNGITVLEFSLGMGPRILSKEWRGTRYSLKLLPFGGSCMMLGEDEEAGEEGSFGSKSVWARISVIAAGPIFNFIMAFLASVIVIAMAGYDPADVYKVYEDYPAAQAGMQAGDVITEINGKKIHLAREVTNYVSFHQGETYTVTYERDGESHVVVLKPVQNENGKYIMGLVTGSSYQKGNVLTTLKYSVYEVKYWIDLTIESLKMLFKGQVGVKEMSGPVGVVNVISETYTESTKISMFAVIVNMLNIAILLSANLGVMNLLPIPALDGGRLVFLVIEAIRGKRINPEKEGMVHFIGLMALMVLMVVILYNDVMRLF
ncbi:MAG: RIP metalloprotease RseP [Muricoprocola sp.]